MSEATTVFTTLREALHAGFHVCDRVERGYLVRRKTTDGWTFGIVDLGVADRM
jgi:hypothetical protein